MIKKFLLLLVLAGVAAGAAWVWHIQKIEEASTRVFTGDAQLAEGPRAPAHRAFGFLVGEATFEEIQKHTEKQGLKCKDTSVRAMMQAKRAAQLKEIEEKKAKGESVDGLSGASWLNKKSPKENNPQIRYACAHVAAHEIGDRERPTANGRWLFVFDGPDQPLRHISYRRIHRNHSDAASDFLSAAAHLKSIYQTPSQEEGEMPVESLALPQYQATRLTWGYADLRVKVSILNFGTRGVDVVEVVEVPWPTRADAPTL